MQKEQIINLVKKYGWDKLPLEKQEEMVEKTGDLVYQEIIAEILKKLPEEKADEFVSILEKTEEADELLLHDFLVENVPNIDDIVRKVVDNFLSETDDIMSKI